MHDIFVRDVVRIGHGKLLCGDLDLVLGRFCTDTRQLQEGDVYVGICGEKFDGNDFYQEAIDRGASCLILSKSPRDVSFFDGTVVLVEDTIKCLQGLALYKRSLYDIPVIAITGSVGKTSTKDLVASVLSKKYKVHKTSGNYNNHLGVPLTVLGMDDCEVLVVEMGMNHFGELSLLSSIVKPTICIITNIGTAHIGILGSRENILKAKLEILEGMVGDTVIVNYDNDLLKKISLELKLNYQVVGVSIDEESTYRADLIKEDIFASEFDILGCVDHVCVNVGGRAYVYNALVAYAVGKCLHLSDDEIKRGIFDFKLSAHRLEKKVTSKGVILIDDTYNASYEAMKSSISLLGKVSNQRKVAILGDMLELGEYTEEFHRNLGDVVVSNGIDFLVTIGESSKWIAKRVIELGMKPEQVMSFNSEKSSYDYLENTLRKDDVVLLKGSHGIHLVGIVDYLMGH